MKRLFTLFTVLAISAMTYGQTLLGGAHIVHEAYFAVPEIESGIGAAAGNDTLGLTEFQQATPAVYQLPTGYGSGTSLSVDTFQTPQGEVVATTQFHGFAEGYLVNDEYNIIGAMFFAGVVDAASGGNPDLTVKAQLIEDNKAISDPATVQSPDIPGPGATLASATVALQDVTIDPSGTVLLPTFVDFTSMPFVDADFCISIDISNVYSGNPIDTIAIVTTSDGEGDEEYTYHQVNQSIAGLGGATIWTPTESVLASGPSSGLNVNFAMFPIVTESTGIEDAGYFDGLKMQTYPNPAHAADAIRLNYGLETAKQNVNLSIYAMDGQLVFTESLGGKTAGMHTLHIPAGTFAAGTYVYALQADGARMAKRMEVLK